MYEGMSYVFDSKWFEFSMAWEMRPYWTLSKFHKKNMAKEGVDFGQ